MERRASSRMLTVALIIIALLLLNAGCVSLERKLLFFPTHETRVNGLTPWMLSNQIIGYTREVEQPKHVWLLLHGNGGQAADRSYAIPHFANDDSVYIMEYPGYGQRAGTPSKKMFNEAALKAYRELRVRFPSQRIGVVGESIGSGAATFLCSLPQPPDKLVLIVPFDHLKLVAREHFPSWLVALLLRDDWNNVESLANYRGPIDIYGAEHDEVIPVSHAQALATSTPQARFTMIHGGHNDWSLQPEVLIRYE